MPVVKFAQIAPPNTLDEGEARFLVHGLLGDQPSAEAVRAALQIELGLQDGVEVLGLAADEMEAIVAVLAAASEASPMSWSLQWLEQNMRRCLADDGPHGSRALA